MNMNDPIALHNAVTNTPVMKKTSYLYALLLFFGACLLAADQATKFLALAHVTDGPIAVTPFFNLVLVWNKGVSFGMLGGLHDHTGPYLLVATSLIITVILAVWMTRTTRAAQQWALAATMAGAIGNVINRLIHGAVVDFLDFHAFGYHWPAFNIADCCVVVGIAILVIDSLFFEPKSQPSGNA